ncbi:hypothetical protein M899_0340 [Bacteriovorax sp. BSW11_IV]|uniref:hypothetical protein n=1 Tax=Bacteriovorax sp. BSW11_IV TaxID=1353529 RepID=UPI00038A2CED|nr:hypothetical protein [Bacteriovorax sp. BSW11_IV]EQC50229.1 hypothetical protein M899_0340 [Bacteriovorax sp. BSW11_IV]
MFKILFSLFLAMTISLPTLGKEFDLNPLRFTNRAQCALDSNMPADSVFLIINNVDPGRAFYKLAKLTGSDPKVVTKNGIEVFRYTVINLFQIIHNKLLNRELPLLPSDTTRLERHLPDDYTKFSAKCSGQNSCKSMQSYIQFLWENSERKTSSASKVIKNYELDNFHSKDNYLVEKNFEKEGPKLFCHYLKKFSPLQAHLYGTKPNRKAYEQFAVALDKIDDYLGECDRFDNHENLKVAAYQFDIAGVKEKHWNELGFDYWHSLKTYFSWAFRNASVVRELSNQYYSIFKGLEIENLVMLMPNSCKSIEAPKCNSDLLGQKAIREFAQSDFKTQAFDADIFDGVPNGPQDDLVTDPFTEVNTDILDLSEFDLASQWAQNMTSNLSGTRNTIKNNVVKAVNFINIMSRHFPLQKFEVEFQKQFQTILNSGGNNAAKNELYYLCSEYYFLAHETFSSVRGNLDVLAKTNILDEMVLGFSQKNISELFSYFDIFSKQVIGACSKLSQKEIFDDEFELEKAGYAQWYLDKTAKEKRIQSQFKAKQLEKLSKRVQPLISYKLFESYPTFDNIVCLDASHCARELATSVVEIFRAVTYASSLWAKKDQIASNSGFNPYAERLACKVYDPWFKTKSMIFNLVSDIGQAALTFTTPGLIYGRLGLQPGRVVSFKQLVKEGMIEYDPQMKPQRIVAGLAADFGPLLGVPCKISIANTANNPYENFRFVGISAGTCSSKEEHTTIANSGSDVSDLPVEDRSACAGCQINFEGVATSLTHVAQNVGPIYFLVRGFVRLYKALKDPHNIPRDWEAVPSDIYDTYKKYGYIPERCVKKFRKGRACR